MRQTKGYAAQDAKSPLAPFSFHRRDPRENDIAIDILYCGVCHSDIHQARNEWGGSIYPMVPGHEIVGRVMKAGSRVRKFREGDLASVGCMVDSCRTCENCREGLEQFCDRGATFTYNGTERDGTGPTFGGYSENIVVDEAFALKVPQSLDLKAVAPLLCAGITTYSPLRHWRVGKNQRVGVIGLGGLGHMAVKFARAFGAEVAVFTTSPNKKEDALRLGAHEVIVTRNNEFAQKNANSFSFILDAVSAQHDINPYLQCLRRDGTLAIVGVPVEPHAIGAFSLIGKRRQFAGSLIGGIPETQEMLNFCGDHGIVSDVEMVRIQDINQAYERMIKGDVKYRFVIDMESLKGV